MKRTVALVDRLQNLASIPLDRRTAGGLGLALLAALALPDATPAAPRRKKGKRRKQEGGTSRGGQGNNANDKRPHNDGTHPGHSGGSGDDTSEVHYCGGLIGKPCPDGYTCVDDPSDDCDPENGGADCGGICVKDGATDNPCAAMLCAEGLVCCPRCGGLCIPPDVKCSDKLCKQVPCGSARCGPGEFCCSASCGQCSSIGGACTDRYCLDEPDPDPEPDPGPGVPCGRTTCDAGGFCCDAACGICGRNGICPMYTCVDPEPQQCGKNVCGAGEYCCNPSCGVCAPMDGACTQQMCLDPAEAVSD